MVDFAQQLFERLSGDEFDEKPVPLEEFVTGEEFLREKGLSKHQMDLAKAMSQIYKKATLEMLYMDRAEAEERWRQTCKEVVAQLGKGAGKDFVSTIAVAYVVYQLMCLKEPAEYYGKSSGDSIDIINIAINADQAQRVFFDNFMNKIKKCHWFEGKYEAKANSVKFNKNINVYSGHSEREAFEGYNTLMVILDEISGFAMAPDEASGEEELKKTSKGIYKMYRASVTSRFPDFGKLVLLSFPRFEGDFIQQSYDALIAEKEVLTRSVRIKRDPDLPDGIEENEMDVEWDEDHIIRYARPKVFAMRRPSWEVNPERKIQDYADDFFDDVGDALGRFACMPSNITRGFFRNMEKVREAFSRVNGVDSEGVFHDKFKPKPDTSYFVHVDLAQKHDKCAVAVGHVDKWIEYQVGSSEQYEYLPLVVVDAIRWWTPTKEKTVDFSDVIEFIKAVRRRGFNIKLATFDRWNSHDTMNNLEYNGIKTDILSVAKKHYDDFLVTAYDSRLIGPHEEVLLKELSELVEKKGKVDHPRKGNKDLSDAVCGAIFNAVSLTPLDIDREVDVYTYADLEDADEVEYMPKVEEKWDRPGVIVPPKRGGPPEEPSEEIQALLDQMARIL